jgi:hypothetical protein
VDAAAVNVSGTAASKQKLHTGLNTPATTTSKKTKPSDFFPPNWESLITPTKNTTKVCVSKQSRYDRVLYQVLNITDLWNSLKRLSKPEQRHALEEIGGFNDADVEQPAVANRLTYQGRILPFLDKLCEEFVLSLSQPGVMIVDDMTTLQRPSTGVPIAANVTVNNSRGFQMLPVFVKDRWKSQVLPSLRHVVGQSRMPWDLDQNTNHFETVVQTVIDSLYGFGSYKVLRGSQIYIQVSYFLIIMFNEHF